MDLQKQLDLFHANPPRLFPHLDFQRPIIEQMLAFTAATDAGMYEDRLEKFNRMCDEYGVRRFARVIVAKEEIPAPPVEDTAITVEPDSNPEVAAAVLEQEPSEPAEAPKKRSRKKKDTSPTL